MSCRLISGSQGGLACWALLLLSAGVASAEERDWKKYPAIIEVDTDQEIYAIGDAHGDYERLVNLLVAGKLIAEDPGKPESVKWSAGKAVLVFTGDMIDKGDQSVRVLQLTRALQADAARAGGRVVVTMGNHEAEFLARPTAGGKTAEFQNELLARDVKPEDVAAGTDSLGLGAFLRSLPFAARVNDWFFAHAGHTRGKKLAVLREEIEAGVTAKGYGAGVLLDADGLLEARLHPHPWWEKDGDTADAARKRLAEYGETLGVHHFVLGHTPGKVTFADGTHRKSGELFAANDGLLFLIDVGMSRGVGNSTGAILRIHSGKSGRASVIDPEGKSKLLWQPK